MRKKLIPLSFWLVGAAFTAALAQVPNMGPGTPNALPGTLIGSGTVGDATCVGPATTQVQDCGSSGAVAQSFTANGALPSITANNGYMGGNSTNGLLLSGSGATYDIVAQNKSGATAWEVQTGTNVVQFPGVILINTASVTNGGDLFSVVKSQNGRTGITIDNANAGSGAYAGITLGNSTSGSESTINLAGGSFTGTPNYTIFTNGGTNYLEADGSGNLFLPSLANVTTAKTGSVCWNTGGAVTYDNTNTCLVSSAQFKKNISPIDEALPKIMAMRPIWFEYKDQTGIRAGQIAEEMARIEPRLVEYDEHGAPNKIKYIDQISVLVKAIQEQQFEIDALRKRIK